MKSTIKFYIILSILYFNKIGFINAQNILIEPSGITPKQGLTIQKLPYDSILGLTNQQEGAIVYDLTFHALRLFNGSKWVILLTSLDSNIPDMTGWKIDGISSSELGYSITLDINNNIIVTGKFHGTVTFGTTTLTPSGSGDIFIAKFDKQGNNIWAKKAGGDSYDESIAVATDPIGNIFIAGYFYSTAFFGPNSNDYITSLGYADAFLAKYDNNGQFQWVRKCGGSSFEIIYSISCDNQGNVLATGNFHGTSIFSKLNSDTTVVASNSNANIFIARYNQSNGDINLLMTHGGTNSNSGIVGKSIISDNNGNIHLSGFFYGTISLNNNIILNTTIQNNTDAFFSKLNPNTKQWVWAKQCGGKQGESGLSLVKDSENNMYLSGMHGDSATFGNFKIYAANLINHEGLYVLKYNQSGNILWIKSFDGGIQDVTKYLAINQNDEIFLTAYYQNLKFEEKNYSTADGAVDIMIAKLNKNGSVNWLVVSNSNNNQVGYGITANENEIYSTGYFINRLNIGSTVLNNNDGNYHFYITRILNK